MKKSSFLLIALFLNTMVFGQLSSYKYKRSISGVLDDWHSIQLPGAMFGKVHSSFNDLRIYGITAENDTIEAPYFISTKKEEVLISDVDFEVLNSVKNARGYFYTLKMKEGEIINSIDLNFGMNNFDWKIRVEGSHDEHNWFTVVDQYRILSINTEFTSYSYNHVSFPNASYTYYRVFIPSPIDPQFIAPKVTLKKHIQGSMKQYEVVSEKQTEKKKEKETVMHVRLDDAVPLSEITINCEDDFDYYRPIQIEYLYDSVETKDGYLYEYRRLASGTFSSLEENAFHLGNVIANKLRITIKNHDNKPLKFSSVELKGQMYELHARFTDEAKYVLAYGNDDHRAPVYDIDHFMNKVPENLTYLKLGKEIKIPEADEVVEETDAPLLGSKAWIWGLMGIAIVLLGWFTFKMLRAEGNK